MANKNVKRLIFVAAPGIYNELPEQFNEWNKEQFGDKLNLYRKASDIIENSNLDYTIIRPGWLTDKNENVFEVTTKDETFKGTEVSRKSVASLAVQIAKIQSYILKKILVLINLEQKAINLHGLINKYAI